MSNQVILNRGARIRAEHGELLVVLEHVHWMVHQGYLFQGEYLASVANNGNMDLLLTTGALLVHYLPQINAGGACNLYLYEEPTASGGTSVPLYNMRRNSANVPLSTLVHTPTVSSVGSTALIPGRYLPGGASTPSRVGGEVRPSTEWNLKPNTKYLLRVTNVSGASITISAAMAFYEHNEE